MSPQVLHQTDFLISNTRKLAQDRSLAKCNFYGETKIREATFFIEFALNTVMHVALVRLLTEAAVAEWYRYRTVACFVTSSSPVPLKTRRVGQRCTLNLSRA
ncbi:hypothetical protein TNCV_21661 [Trichonephila clavipes]|nr:hypothetical protein TNCV_21661 [Trichonephila clavipes]